MTKWDCRMPRVTGDLVRIHGTPFAIWVSTAWILSDYLWGKEIIGAGGRNRTDMSFWLAGFWDLQTSNFVTPWTWYWFPVNLQNNKGKINFYLFRSFRSQFRSFSVSYVTFLSQSFISCQSVSSPRKWGQRVFYRFVLQNPLLSFSKWYLNLYFYGRPWFPSLISSPWFPC